jgi:hypothetical protein
VDSGWTAPRPITARPSRFQPVLMRTGRGGTLVVAWERGDEKGYEARRRVDGRWGPVLSWADKTGVEGDWSAAMDRRGNTTLGWIDEDGVIWARSWPRPGRVGASRVLVHRSNLRGATPGGLQVAAGSGGHVVVAYVAGASGGLHVLRARNGGSWLREPTPPLTNGLSGYQVAVEPSGAVNIAWIADRYTAHQGIWYSRLSAGQGSR